MAKHAGIDIGAGSVKVAVLETSLEEVRLLSLAKIKTSAFAGEIGNVKDLAPVLAQIRAATDGAACTVGLSGPDVVLRFSKLQTPDISNIPELMGYEIAEIKEKSEGGIETDYGLLNIEGLSAEHAVLTGMVKTGFIDSRLSALKAGKIAVDELTAAPLGLFAAYLQSGTIRDSETTVLLDIGRNNTQFCIVREGALLFARNLTVGSGKFVDAVMNGFGADEETALATIAEEGSVHPDERGDSDLNRALAAAADGLGQTFVSTFNFAISSIGLGKPRAARVILAGDGSRLRGLRQHLMGVFGALVEYFDPFVGLDLKKLSGKVRGAITSKDGDYVQGADFTTAIGLALMGSNENAFKLAFIPGRIRKRQKFLRRTIWLYAAGAIMVSSLVLSILGAQNNFLPAKQLSDSERKEYSDYQSSRRRQAELLSEGKEVMARSLVLSDFVRGPSRFLMLYDLVRKAMPPEMTLITSDFEVENSAQRRSELEILVYIRHDERDVESVSNEFLAFLRDTGCAKDVVTNLNPEIPADVTLSGELGTVRGYSVREPTMMLASFFDTQEALENAKIRYMNVIEDKFVGSASGARTPERRVAVVFTHPQNAQADADAFRARLLQHPKIENVRADQVREAAGALVMFGEQRTDIPAHIATPIARRELIAIAYTIVPKVEERDFEPLRREFTRVETEEDTGTRPGH
ncbi:MAG: pilus assembly protein PilM [Planctomycetes bacterium]|nr:pilus assembly protein PilM [Planctomycetota bacterium]